MNVTAVLGSSRLREIGQAASKERWNRCPGSSTASQCGGPCTGAEGLTCRKVTRVVSAGPEHEWSGIFTLMAGMLLPPLLLHIPRWWGRELPGLGGQSVSLLGIWLAQTALSSEVQRHPLPHHFPLRHTHLIQAAMCTRTPVLTATMCLEDSEGGKKQCKHTS